MSPDMFEENKAQWVITTIRNLFAEKSNPTCGRNDDNGKIEDQMFIRICKQVAELTPDEFNYLEEQLLEFLMRDWETSTNCCFKTLNFIGDLFYYICSIASQDIVLQYLRYFSMPGMPAQVRLCLYPTVLQTYRSRFYYGQESAVDFICSIEKFICEKDVAHLTVSDSNELVSMWKKALVLFVETTDTNFDKKLLTGFLACQESIAKLCEIDKNRIVILELLSTCLNSKPTVTTLLLCCLFIIFLQPFQITQSSFSTMCSFLKNLKNITSHHRNITLTDFVTEVISSFLNSAQVSDENLVSSITETLQDKLKIVGSLQPVKSTSQEKPLSHSTNIGGSATTPGSNSARMLKLLETLVEKMKTSNVRFGSKAEAEKIQKIISDLNSFL